MRALVAVALAIVVALVVSLVGCANDGDAPPYEELSLRDALRADPAAIASMPEPARKTLAERLSAGADAPGGEERVALDSKRMSAREIVGAIDLRRESLPADAWPLAIVEVDADSAKARAPARPSTPTGPANPPTRELPPLPPLEGEPAAEATRALEERAMKGRVADVLRAMFAESGATHLVRVTGWPVGAVAVDDMIYVNAAWLVANAARETDIAVEPAAKASGGGGALVSTASVKPATIRGNPYSTYTTLASCVADIGARCDGCRTNGACDEDATLDFPDGRSECLFLLEDRARIDQLCILALMSSATVSECVKKEGCVPPTGGTTQGSLGAAIPFLQKDACVRALNLCLSGVDENRDAPPNTRGNDIRVEGCSDPFASCSSFYEGCGKACDQGTCNGRSGPSCSSCEGCSTCSDCDTTSRTGKKSGYGSTGAGVPSPVSASSSTSSGSSGSTSGSSGSTSGSSGGASGSSGSTSGSSGSTSGSSGSSGSTSGSSGSTSGSSGSTSGSSGSSGSSSSSDGCGGKKSSSSSSSSNSCGSCNNGSCNCGGSNCNNCEEAPQQSPPRIGAVMPLFWLALPVMFLGKRARRQKRPEQEKKEVAR